MKISYNFMPLWMKLLTLSILIFCIIMFKMLNFSIGIWWILIAGSIFVGVPYYVIRKTEKWIKQTMENDPFVQSNNFKLGSSSMFCMLMISDEILRVIVYNTKIKIDKSTVDVAEIYKDYPRQGTDMMLNGLNVYFLDIYIKDIVLVKPINITEAGNNTPLFGKILFGIYLQLKDGTVYVIDTKIPKEFCAIIQKNNTLY